jgi:hypothetical protein
VTHILLTHAHLDHITGVDRAKRAFEAPVFLHEADLPLYRAVVEQGLMFGLRVDPQPPVDRLYEDGMVIAFGRYEARPHHTPGHCPGGVCLQVGEAGTAGTDLFVGDTLFAGSIGLFIRREHRTPHPLLDTSVFRVRRFTLAGLSMAMFFISVSMVTILGPFYYEGVLNYRPEQVGLIFMVLPAVMMFGSPIAGRMYDRTHSPYYAPLGQVVRGRLP